MRGASGNMGGGSKRRSQGGPDLVCGEGIMGKRRDGPGGKDKEERHRIAIGDSFQDPKGVGEKGWGTQRGANSTTWGGKTNLTCTDGKKLPDCR